jgi:uncharacterized protein YbcV (DUF1398 family)
VDQRIQDVLAEALQGSDDGRLHFGQVVGMLLNAGVESYQIDYRAHRATYYMRGGDTFTIGQPERDADIGTEFEVDEIKAAIAKAQRGEVMYPEFKRLSQAAGCVGYFAWLAGRRVTYFGRDGDIHVERFPD